MSIPEYFDEDSIVWLSPEIFPNPRLYAEMLLMTKRELARELLAARKTPAGWKYHYDPHSTTIRELRALGLCDVAGYETAPHPNGPGWHVTFYGLVVRNRILQILATRELEYPLDEVRR